MSVHGIKRKIDSPCECEHNNPDSLDARVFSSVVLAVAPAVTMDEASSLSRANPNPNSSKQAHPPDMARPLRMRYTV